jgi:hypothetical protein
MAVSGWSAVNPLVAFNDIRGRMGDALFFYSVMDTRDDVKDKRVLFPISSYLNNFIVY